MNYNIIVFLLFSLVSFGQNPIGVDSLMRENKIKIKTQLLCDSKGENCSPEYIWEYDQLGRLLEKKFFRNDSLIETNRYEYNNDNWATKVYTAHGDGAEFLNIKYGYDSQNNLVTFDACYESGRCLPFEKYKYRTDGKLSSRTRYRDGLYFYEYRHKYDKRGNNIEILILSNDSDSGEREIKTYNSKNQHIWSKWIDYTGEEIDRAEYEYDDAGNLVKNMWVGGLSTQKLYKYDSLGNNTEYTSIDYTNQVDDQRLMTYDNQLITSRAKNDGKKIVAFWKFEYVKW